MWDLDHKVSEVSENWCFWGVVLDKAFGNALNCKEIKPVYPKGNKPWIFTGKTDAEAEAPIFWPLDVKCWLIKTYPDYGKDWRQEEKWKKRTRCLDSITVWMDMNLSELGRWWWAGKPGMLQSMGSQRVRHNWVTEQFQGISSLRNRTCISCSNCIGM